MPKLIHLLRGDLDWIVMKCLEKDRARRYETANGLAMDLQRHLNNEPVVARPPSAVYRLQKAFRRHKLAFTAMAAVSVSLLLGIVVSTTQAIRAARAENAATQQKQNAQHSEQIAKEESQAAQEQRRRADASAQAARQSLYEADMILAQHATDEGNLGLALELLNKHRPEPGNPDLRDWEWRHLWGLCQSDELGVLATNSGLKMWLALSRDGRLLSAAESIKAKASVYLFEFPSGRLLAIPETNDASGSVSFSADGKLLAFGTRTNGIKLWDVAAGREFTNFPGVFGNGWFSVLQFSPEGHSLAASRDSPEVVVWDATTGRQIATLTNHSGFVSSLAFSPDGSMLATGSFDNTVRIWFLATGRPLGSPLVGHRAAIQSLAFSPDGKTLASASWDRTIRIWDVIAQRQIAWLTNHTGVVTSVAFSPNQPILASCSTDFSIRLWDTTSWQEAGVLRGNPDELWSLAFLPDAKRLVSGGKEGAIRIWSAVPKARKPELLECPNDAEAWGLCGEILYCAHTNGTISYWNAATLLPTAQYTWPEEDRTNSIARDFSPKGKLVWANTNRDEVVVWDLSAARQIARLPWVHGTGKFLKISPNEKILVGGATDARCLTVWDLEKLAQIATLPKSEESDPAARGSRVNVVDVMSFSPDSRLFAYGNWNGTIEVWDLPRKQRLATWPIHHEPVSGLAFMPDGKRLVSVSTDATAKLWDVDTGREVRPFARALNSFDTLAVAPDGQRVAGAESDGNIKIWNAATGQEVATLQMRIGSRPAAYHFASGLDTEAAEDVISLQFLPPDGKTLIACTTSKVRIWQAPTWAEIEAAEVRNNRHP
jgi:WD40 repeat protein